MWILVAWSLGVESTSAEGYATAANMIAELDHHDMLSQVKARTLALAGEHDQAVSVETMRQICLVIPAAQLQVIGAPHLANVQAPAQFTEAVMAFASAS